MSEFLPQKKARYGTVSINTTSHVCSVCVVGPDVKPVEIVEWDGQKKVLKDPELAAPWRACVEEWRARREKFLPYP